MGVLMSKEFVNCPFCGSSVKRVPGEPDREEVGFDFPPDWAVCTGCGLQSLAKKWPKKESSDQHKPYGIENYFR